MLWRTVSRVPRFWHSDKTFRFAAFFSQFVLKEYFSIETYFTAWALQRQFKPSEHSEGLWKASFYFRSHSHPCSSTPGSNPLHSIDFINNFNLLRVSIHSTKHGNQIYCQICSSLSSVLHVMYEYLDYVTPVTWCSPLLWSFPCSPAPSYSWYPLFQFSFNKL